MPENNGKMFGGLGKYSSSYNLYAGPGESCKLMLHLALAKRIQVPFCSLSLSFTIHGHTLPVQENTCMIQ